MATPRQIDANRRNAQKSTGPRTEEGKERARLNGVTHGMTATFDILPGEDAEAYQERLDAFIADLKPRNAFERELVERIVRASWLLDQVERVHVARLTDIVHEAAGGETLPGEANLLPAGLDDASLAARTVFEDSRECERFRNDELSCQRALLRAIETFLKTRQASRSDKSIPTGVGVVSGTGRPAPADRRIGQNEPNSEPIILIDDEPIATAEAGILRNEPSFATIEPGILRNEPSFATAEAAILRNEPSFATVESGIWQSEPNFDSTESGIWQSEPNFEPIILIDDEPIATAEPVILRNEPKFAAAESGIWQSEPNFACFNDAKDFDEHTHKAKVLPQADRRSYLSVRPRCRDRRHEQHASLIAARPTRTFTSARRLSNDRRRRGCIRRRALVRLRSTRWIESQHDPPRRSHTRNYQLTSGPWRGLLDIAPDIVRLSTDVLVGTSRSGIVYVLCRVGRCYSSGPCGNLI